LLNLLTSSNPSVALPLPWVLFPFSRAALGVRYVGKMECTLVRPAEPGGVEVGKEEGKAERSDVKFRDDIGGVGETMLSERSWVTWGSDSSRL
jgi:hypothetical protein